MLNHEKVQDIPLSQGEIFEFVSAVVEQLPRDLEPAKVRYYNEKKSRIGKDIRPLFARTVPLFDTAEWERLYAKHFNLAGLVFSGLHVPEKPNYPCRAVVVVPQVTNNHVFEACTKAFKTWRYENDLDTVRDIVTRPNGPYVVWVRDVVEADEHLKNKSANDIEIAGLNTLTLKERMLLESKYFYETDRHLDVQNVTLCAGSRCADGGIPCCSWFFGKFYVGWYNSGSSNPSLRSREAVS